MGSRGGGVNKRGAEVLRIACLALMRHGGITICGDKARGSVGYDTSHGVEELRVDRLGVRWEPVAVPRRRWHLGASPGKATPKPGAGRSGECFV